MLRWLRDLIFGEPRGAPGIDPPDIVVDLRLTRMTAAQSAALGELVAWIGELRQRYGYTLISAPDGSSTVQYCFDLRRDFDEPVWLRSSIFIEIGVRETADDKRLFGGIKIMIDAAVDSDPSSAGDVENVWCHDASLVTAKRQFARLIPYLESSSGSSAASR